MIIGIDIDDTITDTYEVMINYSQQYVIDVLKKEPILKEGNCAEAYYTRYLYDWKNEEDFDFLNIYYEKIMKELKPKTLAVEYLKRLHNEGNKIILITARWKSEKFDVEKCTIEWIKNNNIPYDKLIINAENKLIAAKQEKIDVFIDDTFKNCKMIADNGIKTYLMDTRVNRGLIDNKIERVYSWPHLYMKLKHND